MMPPPTDQWEHGRGMKIVYKPWSGDEYWGYQGDFWYSIFSPSDRGKTNLLFCWRNGSFPPNFSALWWKFENRLDGPSSHHQICREALVPNIKSLPLPYWAVRGVVRYGGVVCVSSSNLGSSVDLEDDKSLTPIWRLIEENWKFTCDHRQRRIS